MLQQVFVIIFVQTRTLSWCQTSGKIQGGIYSDRTYTQNNNNTDKFKEEFTVIELR